MTNVEIQL